MIFRTGEARRFFLLSFCYVPLMFTLAGCTVMQAAKARLEPRQEFVKTDAHPQLHYLAQAETAHSASIAEMARRLAQAMDASIETVERMHGRNFLEPPRVYVCDAECFSRFSTLHRSVPAAHFMDSVFMNDPELRKKERQYDMPPERFLVHELTHLYFYQHAGALAYMRTPAWFREGWAVVVSDGAGAQACTPEEAARHLVAGASFDPGEEGSLFRNRTAASYGLPYPVFYRQAAMFIEYLRNADPAAFQAALGKLLDGEQFQSAFAQAYGTPISAYWPAFLQSIRSQADRFLGQAGPGR